MASPIKVKAIFDIGKTNKKFLLFDEHFSVVYRNQVTQDQMEDDDGYPCENLDRLVIWIKEECNKALQQKKYQITDMNFTTYGATLVHLDKNRNVITPLYNYLKPYPDDVAKKFYIRYGGRKRLSLQTASPPMGMLNSGLQLYWLKQKKSEIFAKIDQTLHFPQYISYLFTGYLCSELTSIGCHTAMWDFESGNYHDWIREEGMEVLLPEIQPVSSTRQIDYGRLTVQTGIGIHDSSAALAPFLFATDKPFIQLSTGTWSVAFNPFTSDPLTYEELEKDSLYYMNIYGKPVKASRLFLGNEYTHQLQKIGQYFGRPKDRIDCEPEFVLFQKLARHESPQHKFIFEKMSSPGVHQSNENNGRDLSRFNSYEEACHQLMLDLVLIQLKAMQLVWGSTEINQIVITGGFSQNDFFTRLLATFLPGKKIYTASIPDASALGAMLVMGNETHNQYFIQKLMEWKTHNPFESLNLKGYK